jgi:hypothetical protein
MLTDGAGGAVKLRDKVFVRKARHLAEQALYFLHHLRDTEGDQAHDGAIKAGYACFVIEQVAALVSSLHLSHAYLRPSGADPARVPPPAIALWRDHIWEPVNRRARSDGLPERLAQAGALTDAFERFLTESRSVSWRQRFRRRLKLAHRWVHRRLTVVLGAAVSLLLLWQVEPVRSLIFNQGWCVLLVVAAALAPVAVHRLIARRLGLRWGMSAYGCSATDEPDHTISRWPPGSPYRYEVARCAARSLLVLTAGLVSIGAMLGARSVRVIGGTSYLTLFCTFALIVLFLRLCRCIDRWDFIDERAIRMRALLYGLLLATLILTEAHRLLLAAVLLMAAAMIVVAVRDRAPKWVNVGLAAIALLATTSVVWGRRLSNDTAWRDPPTGEAARPVRIDRASFPLPGDSGPVVLLAASGGGSRAAIYTAKTLLQLEREYPYMARRLQAVSSVSGGSLASAAYIARRLRGDRLSDLEEAMGGDFLLPTLLGAMAPWGSRGTFLEQDWRAIGTGRPGLGAISLSNLTAAWMSAAASGQTLPPFPLPLFNSCTLDGHAVVISPLPRELYTRADSSRLETLRKYYELGQGDIPTWVVDRDGIYGFEDLLPAADPLLARAVRASANFPFGFPLVDVITRPDRLFLKPAFTAFKSPRHADGEAVVKLTDGGVLSNSGMWSLFQLMTDQTPAGESGDSVMKKLVDRGVLLIIVEASRMPEYSENRRSLLTLYGAIADKNPIAQNLHRRMFETLRASYGKRLAIVQLDLIAQQRRESFNVYTTWALDPRSKETLDKSFARVWTKSAPQLADRFAKLAAHADPGPDALLRPPLD